MMEMERVARGKIGAHVELSAFDDLGCLLADCVFAGWGCAQVFLGSSRDHITRRQLNESDYVTHRGFTLYTHFPYTMNLVKPRTLGDLSGLQYELDTLEKLGGYVVIHPNSPAVKGGPSNMSSLVAKENTVYVQQYKNAIDMMIDNIKLLHNLHKLLLKPPSGEGQRIGWSFEQMNYICDRLTEEHLPVGFCIDTCYSFGSGLTTFEDVSATRTFLHKLRGVGVLDRLKVVHLNDSLATCRSLKGETISDRGV